MGRTVTSEPGNVLYRVKRGLAGYVSYLAACEMNQAFSEYVLYEPILRILMARGYTALCEVKCPGVVHAQIGDAKKLDFVAEKGDVKFALEAKWAKQRSLDVTRDLEKLRAFQASEPCSWSFLCVFGRKKHISHVRLNTEAFVERGDPIFAEFGVTRFGCRVFELKRSAGTTR
jgi:hypothetical protein